MQFVEPIAFVFVVEASVTTATESDCQTSVIVEHDQAQGTGSNFAVDSDQQLSAAVMGSERGFYVVDGFDWMVAAVEEYCWFGQCSGDARVGPELDPEGLFDLPSSASIVE